jgi:predicted HicB family RNase H-like nuclease
MNVNNFPVHNKYGLESGKCQQKEKVMKESEASRIGVRVSKSLKKRIADTAWKKRTTISNLVIEALEDRFPDKKKAKTAAE